MFWSLAMIITAGHSEMPCVEIVKNFTQVLENSIPLNPGSANIAADNCQRELQNNIDCTKSIEWLRQNEGKTEMEACYQIGIENKCPACKMNIVLPPSIPPLPPSLPSPPFLPSSASCLSHYKCLRQGLNGQCCPGIDGNFLDCCTNSSASSFPLSPAPSLPPLPLNPPAHPVQIRNNVWNSLSISLLISLICSLFIIFGLIFCNFQMRISVVEDSAVNEEK